MLDIRFIRENPELVRENIKKKFQDAKLPLVDEVLGAGREEARRHHRGGRAARPAQHAEQAGRYADGQAKKDPSKLEEAEAVKAQGQGAGRERLAELEKLEVELRGEACTRIMLHDPEHHRPQRADRPATTAENVEVQRFGEPVTPDFEIPYHTEIMERFDGIDLDAARPRRPATGFYYLLGDIARLHEAVLAYARDFHDRHAALRICIPPLHDPRQRGRGRDELRPTWTR